MHNPAPTRTDVLRALAKAYGTHSPDAAELAYLVDSIPGLTVHLTRIDGRHGQEYLAAAVALDVTAGCAEEHCMLVFAWDAFTFEPYEASRYTYTDIADAIINLDARAVALRAALTR